MTATVDTTVYQVQVSQLNRTVLLDVYAHRVTTALKEVHQ